MYAYILLDIINKLYCVLYLDISIRNHYHLNNIKYYTTYQRNGRLFVHNIKYLSLQYKFEWIPPSLRFFSKCMENITAMSLPKVA